MEKEKTGRKRKSTSERPSINEPFTKEEFDEMSMKRERSGLSWHDIILKAIEEYNPESPTEMLK